MGRTPSTKVVQDLILWARREGIVLQQISVGQVHLVIGVDRKMAVKDGIAGTVERARRSLYDEMSGGLLEELSPAETARPTEQLEPIIEDEDDE